MSVPPKFESNISIIFKLLVMFSLLYSFGVSSYFIKFEPNPII